VQVIAFVSTERESREGHSLLLMTFIEGKHKEIPTIVKAFKAGYKPSLQQPRNNLLDLVYTLTANTV